MATTFSTASRRPSSNETPVISVTRANSACHPSPCCRRKPYRRSRVSSSFRPPRSRWNSVRFISSDSLFRLPSSRSCSSSSSASCSLSALASRSCMAFQPSDSCFSRSIFERSRSRSSIAPLAEPIRNCESESICRSLSSSPLIRCTWRVRVIRSELITCMSACVALSIVLAFDCTSCRSAFSRSRRWTSCRASTFTSSDVEPLRCSVSMPVLEPSMAASISCRSSCSCWMPCS
mmetsp:Transcript_73960/g.196857  ORF Transcript_73960/g.196857 Transcript_73960/m.196857 type:complete len:234 (-) Transcript_73960:201-902(-)